MADTGTFLSALAQTGYAILRYVQMVDHQSACLHGKRAIYLNTNHSGLNKFRGPNDENFLLVRPEIDRMVKNAPQRIVERYTCRVQIRYSLNIFLFKAPLTIVKHTSQVPKIHKDNNIAYMTSRRAYSKPLHQITRVIRTSSQRGFLVPASGFYRMIGS